MSDKIDYKPLNEPENGKKMVESAYEKLEMERRKFWDKIMNIIKGTKLEEAKNKEENILKHNKRLDDLKRIDEEIPKKQQIIEERIKELMEIEQADVLKFEFENLKRECDSILNEKRILISDFQKELANKDHYYINTLHKFRADIIQIINFMRQQFHSLRDKMLSLIWSKNSFSNDIELSKKISSVNNAKIDERRGCVEGEFLLDRNKLLEEYTANLRELMRELDQAEKDFAEQLTNNENEKELENEKEAFKEETRFINKIIVMEKFFNILKEQIEDFTYELKILLEMLEYRVEVREEKIKENNEKKDQYLKWAEKMKNDNSKIRDQYEKKDVELRKENINLKIAFIKTTESFDHLKDKFRHFEAYDEQRFMKIYNMNFQESKNLAIKVLLADRTIRSQQLGIEEVFTEDEVLDGFTLEELQNALEEEDDNSLAKLKFEQKKKKKEHDPKESFISKVPFDRLNEVFKLIVKEAEFLIDYQVIEKYDNLPFDEKLPYYIESICKALQIKNENDLILLLDLFEKKSDEIKEEEALNNENMDELDNQSERDEKEKNFNRLKIDPDRVIEYFKEFNAEKKKNTKNESKLICN